MKVSVVIPMYNSSETILSCLDSVAGQSYRDLEVIVVDDGSTDDCGMLVSNFASRQAFPVRLLSQPNSGVSSARNNGILASDGEYIAFLDSDDIWDKDKLRLQMQVFSDVPDAVLVCSALNGNIEKNIGFRRFGHLERIPLKWLFWKSLVGTSTVVAKKRVLMDCGLFDETMGYSEDMNLWIKIVRSHSCYYLNRSLAGSLSRSVPGLSSRLSKMYEGELYNLRYARSGRWIGFGEYCVFRLWFGIKYLRRVVMSSRKPDISQRP